MKYSYIIYTSIFFLYCFVGYNAIGFDDEFFNISVIETLSFSQMIDFIQSSDTHPPISYILNKIFFNLFNDWKIVRLFNSVLFSGCICYAIAVTNKKYGFKSSILIFFILGLQPAMLMWGTSLRWYSFFVGILLLASFPPNVKSNWIYWAKFIIGSLLLLYTGYIAILIIPGLGWIYYKENEGPEKRKLISLALALLVVFILFYPQFVIFKNVHLRSGNSQFYSFFSNLQGVFISQFSNQGLFPLTFFAILSAIGFMLLLGVEIQNLLKNKLNESALPYASTIILLVASGLAGRFRSLVVAQPFQAIWIIQLVKNKGTKLVNIAVSMIIISNIAGLINVTMHRETTKNNWNTPMSEILTIVNKESIKGKTIVYCHDPILSYQLEKSGYPVVGPYYINKEKYTLPSAEIVIVIKTNQGVIPIEKYYTMMSESTAFGFKERKNIKLGEDKNFKIKRRIDPSFPKFAAELIVYKDVRNIPQHSTWEWSSGIYSRIRKFSETP